MSDYRTTSPARPLPASGVGGGLREDVARRHGRRRNPAWMTNRSSLRTFANRPAHSPQRWVEKCGRSIKGSETPHCGKPSCACHHDPPRLHGPYWHWTRKIKNKTVGRYLTQPQANESQRWIANDRRIRELLVRLEQIGIQRLEADQHHTQKKTTA